MNNRPKKVLSNMNKTMETKRKEPYEAPAVLDISPVTVNVAVGGSDEYGEPDEPSDDD